METNNIYILKQNLPKGHLKGDRYNELGINLKSGKSLGFKPKNELDFFTIEPIKLYKPNDLVVLNATKSKYVASLTIDGNMRHRNGLTIQPFTEYKIVNFIRNEYLLSDNKLNYFILKETEIKKAVTYWFVNSSGKKINTIEGRFPEKDAYLKSVGNYHSTKEELENYIESLKKIFLK